MPKKSQQNSLFQAKNTKSYGGKLLNTRKGRRCGRPLATRQSMHFVLRSSKAKGVLSFKYKNNPQRIKSIIAKFSHKYGIMVYSLANVGNHLHMHIKLGPRGGYKPFIRAVTSAIAMAVTGAGKGNPMKQALAALGL